MDADKLPMDHPAAGLDFSPRRLDELLRLTRSWGMELTLQDLLDRILGDSATLLGFDRGAIHLIEKQGVNPRACWTKAGLSRLKGTETEVLEVAWEVIKSGRSVFAHRVGAQAATEAGGLTFCVPLTASRGILGTLYLDTVKADRETTRTDQDLLETLGRQAATAIQHSLLYQSAITDPLTNLFCHRHFQQEVEQAIRQAARSSHPVSLIILDLDHFKRINDDHGHETGNQCIVKAADVLREVLRSVDVIARFGGDEFEVLLPDTDRVGAEIAAEKIRVGMANAEFPEVRQITSSLGVSSFPENAATAQGLFLEADEALYHAKEQGRNRAVASGAKAVLTPPQKLRGSVRIKYVPTGPQGGVLDPGETGEFAIRVDEFPDLDKAPSPAEQVDGHKIVRHLGQGSIGEVLLVRQPELDREVALKRPLTPHLTGEQAKSFEREAKVTASLEHPGVITVYSMGRDFDGRHYYTMKPLRGRSLREVFRSKREGHAEAMHEFGANRLIEILHRVSETVAYAHSREITHQDLTPANVMIGEFGEVTVIDWSMSRSSNSRHSSSGSDMEFVVGTPVYRAPEHLPGSGQQPGPAADVYALGVILYEALTGTPPFLQTGLQETLKAVKSGRIVPPEVLKPEEGIAPSLSALCTQALDRDPERRPNAFRFAEVLGRYLRREREWEVIRFDERPIDPEEWTSLRGRWRFGRDDIISDFHSESILVWNTPASGAFQFTCEGWFEQTGELSLIGHGPSPNSPHEDHYIGYCFQCGAEFNTCTKLARYGEDVRAVPGMKLEANRVYRIEMLYDEGRLNCYLDKQPVFSYRELFPYTGRHLGFYGYGKGTHFRPLEIRRQTWALTLPAIQVADDLFRHGSYEAALQRYEQVAEANPQRLEGHEASLKVCRCLKKLGRFNEARKRLAPLRGGLLEPFAMAEEARLDLETASHCRPSRGVAILRELESKHPNSQAKAEILRIAGNITPHIRRMRPGMSLQKSVRLKVELLSIAKNTFIPPAQSQIQYQEFAASYMFLAGRWKEALDELLDFRDRLMVEQANLSHFQSTLIAAALANGRDDLLSSSPLEVRTWDLPRNGLWSTGVIFHHIVRRWDPRKHIDAMTFRGRPRRKAAHPSAKHPLGLQATLLCYLALGDTARAEKWLKNVMIKNYASRPTGLPESSQCYQVGGALVESGQKDLFNAWIRFCSRRRGRKPGDKLDRTVNLLKAQWAVNHRKFSTAADLLDKALQPALYQLEPGRTSAVLRTMVASRKSISARQRQELERMHRDVLAGPELDLCRMFLGKRRPGIGRLWPHPGWRPEWRLWLALWLEAKGKVDEARKIALPARDRRYGLTHCQPALEALLRRVGDGAL